MQKPSNGSHQPDPSNSQIQVELAKVDARICSLQDSVVRIEEVMKDFHNVSKTITELVVLYGYTKETIGEVKSSVTSCRESHEMEADRIHHEVSTLKAELSVVANRAKGALWALGLFMGGICMVGYNGNQWLVNMANNNAQNNATQQVTIDEHTRRLTEMEHKVK